MEKQIKNIKVILTKVGTAYEPTKAYRLFDYIVIDDVTLYTCKRVDKTTMTCVGHPLTDTAYWDKSIDLSDALAKVTQATTDANTATREATVATTNTITATTNANQATENAKVVTTDAETAIVNANNATTRANDAAAGAEKVDATLDNDTLSVTDRTGAKKQLELITNAKAVEIEKSLSRLTSEIVRSEISIEETVENQYMLSTKTIQDDSRYKAYSMDYYPVEPNKFFRIIGTAKGTQVATIALLANKEATEALSVYDVSKNINDIVNADRVLFIPKGVSYIAVSRNKEYTSKCYVVGEGENRLDELENSKANKTDVQSSVSELKEKDSALSDEIARLNSNILPFISTPKDLLGVVREIYVEGIEDKESTYIFSISKKETSLQISISKESAVFSNYYVQSTNSAYDVNRKGIIELSPYGDNGKKAYVFVDFSKLEIGFNKFFTLDISVATNLDFAPSIKTLLSKNTIVQELGDSEEKVLSQKISSNKISALTSEIVRSEISIEETVENQYMLSTKTIQDDSRYKAYSMDYYPVEPNKFFRIIGTAKGTQVATIALLANKEATEALSVYDVSKNINDIVNADRVLFIPKGVSYIAVSRNKEYTSKCYVVGEGENRLDELESNLNSLNAKLEKKVDIDTVETKLENRFKGKILLAIGDSVTEQKYWQNQVGEVLGMKVRTHAKGGIGIIQMVDGDGSGDAPEGYDPDNFGASNIYRLNAEDVKDVSVIVIMGFYNERGKVSAEHGEVSDMYPDNNTYIGRLNYAIKRIYEELAKANNNTCRIVICSAHRFGKYPYSDKDAYYDGDTILQYTKAASDYNSLPCIDLMHNGGINKYNWNLFQSSSTDYNQKYIPADGLNDATNKPFESLELVPDASSNTGFKVTVGTASNYKTYKSNGSSWIIDSARCPWIGDHLHLNSDGGKLLGNYIAAQLLSL